MTPTKKTLVLGASPKSERYSNKAVRLLRKFGHPVVAVGLRDAVIEDVPIIRPEEVKEQDVHTLTLYLSPKNQNAYYDFILSLHPKRVIFNPGTENPELKKLLDSSRYKLNVSGIFSFVALKAKIAFSTKGVKFLGIILSRSDLMF